jgi:hypothetical protein
MIHSLTSTTLIFSFCYTSFLVNIVEVTIPIINIMSEAERPKVGVGVVIHDGAGNIIMGERAGSHGAGTTYLNLSPLSRWLEIIHDRSLACKAFVTNIDQAPSNAPAVIWSMASPSQRPP